MTPALDEFQNARIGKFSHSPKAQLLWKEKTNRFTLSYSKTHWWSCWEVLKQVGGAVLWSLGMLNLFSKKMISVDPTEGKHWLF